MSEESTGWQVLCANTAMHFWLTVCQTLTTQHVLFFKSACECVHAHRCEPSGHGHISVSSMTSVKCMYGRGHTLKARWDSNTYSCIEGQLGHLPNVDLLLEAHVHCPQAFLGIYLYCRMDISGSSRCLRSTRTKTSPQCRNEFLLFPGVSEISSVGMMFLS